MPKARVSCFLREVGGFIFPQMLSKQQKNYSGNFAIYFLRPADCQLANTHNPLASFSWNYFPIHPLMHIHPRFVLCHLCASTSRPETSNFRYRLEHQKLRHPFSRAVCGDVCLWFCAEGVGEEWPAFGWGEDGGHVRRNALVLHSLR